MAHARYAHHMDSPFPKHSSWGANKEPLFVDGIHPDRLEGYPSYENSMRNGFLNGASGSVPNSTGLNGVCQGTLVSNGQSVQATGLKRKWVDVYAMESREPAMGDCALVCGGTYVDENDTKRVCLRDTTHREHRELEMDHTPPCYYDNTAPHPLPQVTDHQSQMDTQADSDSPRSNSCNHFHNRKLELCALSEAGGGCHHFQAVGLSVMDCPRCLAGEPGHLEHILHPVAMDTNCMV